MQLKVGKPKIVNDHYWCIRLVVECFLSELKMINCSDKLNRCLMELSFWGNATNMK